MKHTPGPWTILDRGKLSTPQIMAGETATARIVDRGQDKSAENEANASLIAAAPELLEACQRVADVPFEPDKWRQQVQSAVAKAKGELP